MIGDRDSAATIKDSSLAAIREQNATRQSVRTIERGAKVYGVSGDYKGLTLLNAWAENAAATAPVRIIARPDGRCELFGELLATAATAATIAFVPEEVRPAYTIKARPWCNSAYNATAQDLLWVSIDSTGALQVSGASVFGVAGGVLRLEPLAWQAKG